MISQAGRTFLRRMNKMNRRRACTGETQLQPRNFIRFVGLSPRVFKVQRGPREPAKGLLKPAFRPHASCPNKPSGTSLSSSSRAICLASASLSKPIISTLTARVDAIAGDMGTVVLEEGASLSPSARVQGQGEMQDGLGQLVPASCTFSA